MLTLKKLKNIMRFLSLAELHHHIRTTNESNHIKRNNKNKQLQQKTKNSSAQHVELKKKFH